jgi:hypothetical protein
MVSDEVFWLAAAVSAQLRQSSYIRNFSFQLKTFCSRVLSSLVLPDFTGCGLIGRKPLNVEMKSETSPA